MSRATTLEQIEQAIARLVERREVLADVRRYVARKTAQADHNGYVVVGEYRVADGGGAIRFPLSLLIGLDEHAQQCMAETTATLLAAQRTRNEELERGKHEDASHPDHADGG